MTARDQIAEYRNEREFALDMQSRRVGVIYDTGRRIYRSTSEAFAEADRQTIDYACAIKGVYRDKSDRPVLWTCAVLALCLVGMSWAGWLV